MNATAPHSFPALHNAMWPGLVGKGPDSEPPIDLDTMLDLTAAARVDGVRFDGVDLFLSLPHTDIDSSDDDLARLADKLASKGLRAGSLVAPVWPPTGGGSAMGDDAERGRFLTQVEKACRIGRKLRDLKIRQYGIVRIDSAASAADWAKDPEANTKRIAQTFREAATIAESFGERLAAEGEICWAGMHSWRNNVQLLETGGPPANRRLPGRHGAHHALHHGLQRARRPPPARRFRVEPDRSPGRSLSPKWPPPCVPGRSISTSRRTMAPSKAPARTTRPAATARPTTPTANSISSATPAPGCATTTGEPTRAVQHICWDGCMFPNAVMLDPKTWDDVLRVMIAVRNAHGWN